MSSLATQGSDTFLQSQEWLINLRSLHPRLPVSGARVCSPLISRQVYQGELPEQRLLVVIHSQDNLKDHVDECRLLKIISSTWNTAWLLDEWAFALVCPDVRRLLPWVISLRTSSTQSTSDSVSPTTTTCCFPSSNTRNLDLPDRRSNTYNYEIFFVELMNMILVSCQFICYLSAVNLKETAGYLKVVVLVFGRFQVFKHISCCQSIDSILWVLGLAMKLPSHGVSLTRASLKIINSWEKAAILNANSQSVITWPYAKQVAIPPSKMLWTNDLAVYLYTNSLSVVSSNA